MRRVVLVAMILAVLGAAGLFVIAALSPGGAPPKAGSEEDASRARTRRRHSEPDGAPPAVGPVAAPVVVEEPRPAPPMELALGTGRLRGVVIDAVDRAPVVGCAIRLRHPTGERIAETATDRGGEYALDAMPDGVPLVLELDASGYLGGMCCDVNLAAAQLLRKDVQLVRPPTLRLTVIGQRSREPAAGALVRLSLDGAPVARTSADELGRVRLALPAFGEFVLHLGGREFAERPGETLRVLPGRGDLELERKVLPAAALRVRVSDPVGDPAARATVTVSAEGLSPRTGITDTSGAALFRGLATKTDYEIVAGYDEDDRPALRGQASARAFEDRERVVDVELAPAGRVAGRVTRADGTGIGGASVTVVLRGGTRAATVRTDEDGTFVATGLPQAAVRLEVEAPGYHRGDAKGRAGDPSDEAREHVTLWALSPAIVTGQVTDRAGRELRASVRAVPADVRTQTDEKGRYRLELPGGIEEQRLVASAEGHAMPADGPYAAPAVEALPGREQRVDLLLDPVPPEVAALSSRTPDDEAAREPGGVNVAGRVVDARSAPVARATVSCGGVFGSTDARGRFDLADVPLLDAETGILPPLGVAPPPGLLVPERVTLPPAGPSVRFAHAGEIRLSARPIAILDLTDTLPGATPDALPAAFTLAFSHPDLFAGARTPRMKPLYAVSYDGTWIHLPPADAWRDEGAGRVWALVPTSRGGATSEAAWRLRPGAADALRFNWTDSLVVVRVALPKAYVSGLLTFRMEGSRHEDAGPDSSDERGSIPRDPFRSSMTSRSFTERVRGRTMDVPDVPRGVWTVELAPPTGQKLPVLRAALDTEQGDGPTKIVFTSR